MRIKKTIKFIFAIILAVFALGYCGQMDSDYQEVRTKIVTEGKL